MTVKTLKKQLAAAIAMVLVSVIALSSSTYAWFAANNQVTATGMSVKAQAEGGLLIANSAADDWVTGASATYSGANLTLNPTSTSDVTAWYHNTSGSFTSAAAHQLAPTYETLTIAESNGVGYVNVDNVNGLGDTDPRYYLVNTFYIKSATTAIGDGSANVLYINKIDVSGNANSGDLDKSLRVAIQIEGDSTVYIYAPFAGATTSYYVAGAESATTAVIPNQTTKIVDTLTNIKQIPAAGTDTPLEVNVYMYFEGEDEECKSANIASTLDTLYLTVTFGTEALTTP